MGRVENEFLPKYNENWEKMLKFATKPNHFIWFQRPTFIYLAKPDPHFHHIPNSRDRIVVSTLRCGRSNPGSNPGHGSTKCWQGREFLFSPFLKRLKKLYDPDVTRTRSLLIWSQTRYHCATESLWLREGKKLPRSEENMTKHTIVINFKAL